MIIIGVSGSSGGASSRLLWRSTRSAQRWSRPAVIGGSVPSRSQTITFPTLGAAGSASSTVAFIDTGRPLRGTPSAVISATAPASASLAATAGAPNPEKMGTTIAPILQTA